MARSKPQKPFDSLDPTRRKWIQDAFDLALGGLAPGHANFAPFVVELEEGERSLTRFQAEGTTSAFDAALEHVEELESTPDAVLLVYPQKIHMMDGSFDAVAVNLYEDDAETAWSYGQLFAWKDGQIQQLKKVLALGEVRNALVF